MNESAIILAAGQGKRLNGFNDTRHKSQLKIGTQTFLDLSIKKLLAVGIKQIVVVVGYESQFIKQNLDEEIISKIKFVENSEYASSGNLISLIKGLQETNGPCLFLDADIIYESKILKNLLEAVDRNRFVTSKPCGSGDEVFVNSASGTVVEISKIPKTNLTNASEYIGITAITEEVAQYLRELDLIGLDNYDYESYINENILKKFKFEDFFVPNSVWSEVDKAEDWIRIQAWDEQTISRITVI